MSEKSPEVTAYLREMRAEYQRIGHDKADAIPRRIDMQRWSPAERAIYDAAQAVEAMPADARLTQAVLLLGKARECVADYVDDHQARAGEVGG
jgi:hypothetical protein